VSPGASARPRPAQGGASAKRKKTFNQVVEGLCFKSDAKSDRRCEGRKSKGKGKEHTVAPRVLSLASPMCHTSKEKKREIGGVKGRGGCKKKNPPKPQNKTQKKKKKKKKNKKKNKPQNNQKQENQKHLPGERLTE